VEFTTDDNRGYCTVTAIYLAHAFSFICKERVFSAAAASTSFALDAAHARAWAAE